MDVKKVTFLINSLSSGGAEKVMSVLVIELIRQGYDIELICLEKSDFYQIPKEVKVTYLSSFTGHESGIRKLLSIPSLAWKLKQHIKQKNLTMIQSHIYRANYINTLAKYLGSKHIAQVVNAGKVSHYQELGLLGKMNLFLIKNLYAKADLQIYKSKGMKTDVQKLFDFKNKQIVINNPYDIQNIQNMAFEDIVDFTFNKKKNYVVSVGRLVALKRNKDMLEAMLSLPKHVELIFLGEGKERKELELFAKKVGIEQRVHFLGRVSNPYKYISKSDVLISSSESEGFPNVLVESMVCRTPVISSDCISGPREILAPNTDDAYQLKKDIEIAEYGILYPVGDIENLSKAINLVLNDDLLKAKFQEKAYDRAKDYSVDKIVREYQKVMQNE